MTESAAQVLAEALHTVECSPAAPIDAGYDDAGAYAERAEAILAASPELEAALETGLAWAAAERALPEGWELRSLLWTPNYPKGRGVLWEAVARDSAPASRGMVVGTGRTPILALRALTEKLESNR